MLTQRIGFIGAGQMATALAQGLIRAGLTSPDRVLASDPLPEARDRFAAATGARATDENLAVAAFAEIIFLAVKPQSMVTVLKELAPKVGSSKLVVSIAAGVRLARSPNGLAPACDWSE